MTNTPRQRESSVLNIIYLFLGLVPILEHETDRASGACCVQADICMLLIQVQAAAAARV